MAAVQRSLSLEVMKEPRGALRVLQWLTALLAFSTAAHYNTLLTVTFECNEGSPSPTPPAPINVSLTYPFRLSSIPPVEFDQPCGLTSTNQLNILAFPGNFASDAEFFVFTGVVSWLFCFASIFLYVYYNALYMDEEKSYPKIDFVISAILGMFWLAGSAAWANGLNGIKSVCSILPKVSTLCLQELVTCSSSCSQFSEGNISVLLGFLNCFLWSANLWFLYKETKWFGPPATPATLETGGAGEEPPFGQPTLQ